jgi:hypothetical protein
MKKGIVNIDFQQMAKALRESVRKKAIYSGSTIVYMKSGCLIEENPQTNETRVLQRMHNS